MTSGHEVPETHGFTHPIRDVIIRRSDAAGARPAAGQTRSCSSESALDMLWQASAIRLAVAIRSRSAVCSVIWTWVLIVGVAGPVGVSLGACSAVSGSG